MDGVFKVGVLFFNGWDVSKDFFLLNNSVVGCRLGIYVGEWKMKSLYFEDG